MSKDRKIRKRCSFRKHGGGLVMGDPLVSFNPSADQTFAIRVPTNDSYSDCTFPARQGQLYTAPQVGLAQTVMAGGGCGCNTRSRGGSRKARRARRSNRHRGGNRGYAIYPMSVGADGPNVGALVNPVPCDMRSGMMNPFSITPVIPDSRTPSDVFSLTPNQSGGSYGTGNGFTDACYRATGSSMPVYDAQTAGFGFQPSTITGATMPNGVSGYMDVVPQAARLGGSYKAKRKMAHRKRTSKVRKTRSSK